MDNAEVKVKLLEIASAQANRSHPDGIALSALEIAKQWYEWVAPIPVPGKTLSLAKKA